MGKMKELIIGLEDIFFSAFTYDQQQKLMETREEYDDLMIDYKYFDYVIAYSFEDNDFKFKVYLIPSTSEIRVCLHVTSVPKCSILRINIDANTLEYNDEVKCHKILNRTLGYYVKCMGDTCKKFKIQEEETMSKTNETSKTDRIKVVNQVETISHKVNDSLIVEEIDMLHMIDHVIINAPATIVFWKDGTKTVVKCKDNDEFDPEKGIAMAFTKKVLGNNYNYINKFNTILKKAKTIEDESKAKITFKNNENCNTGTCSCDEVSTKSSISIASAPTISIETAVEFTQVLGEITNQLSELRKEVESLKTKSKKKKKKE